MNNQITVNPLDEELLHFHTKEFCIREIAFYNRMIGHWLRYFKRNKNFVISSDLQVHINCLKRRNRFKRLLKKRLAHDGATK